jgi:hypothetical protein
MPGWGSEEVERRGVGRSVPAPPCSLVALKFSVFKQGFSRQAAMTTEPSYKYRLQIQRESDGAWFPSGPIGDAYLQEARDHALFQSQRRGITGSDLNDAPVGEQPVFASGRDGQIRGVIITVGNGAQQIATTFGLELFAPAARAEARRLVKAGQLADGCKFVFSVFADRVAPRSADATMPAGCVRASVRRAPLPLVDGSLADWLNRAEAVGPIRDEDYPLFITANVLNLSREFSRRTGDKEGGAMLLGHLYRQREPKPEIFGVIDTALELEHAKHEMYSLQFSAETFARINAQLALRRTRLGMVHEIAMGVCHSHNFLPSALDGKPKCAECPLRPTCQLTSSFYSVADEQFHRALFGGRAPFSVGLVWGYTPREEDDLRVFCLNAGQSRERGYYRIAPGS